jgi:hypothetical protein
LSTTTTTTTTKRDHFMIAFIDDDVEKIMAHLSSDKPTNQK